MRLTNTDEENLGIFERKVLRKIAGSRRTEEGECRRLINHEIRDIIEGEDIVGFVKAQRLRWFGHVLVQRRDTQHILRKILNWRPVEGRPRGRPRIRWEDQIHEDIRTIGIEDWRIKIQDRKNWEKTYEQPGSKAESNDNKREEQGGVIHRRKNRIEKLHQRSSVNSASNNRLYRVIQIFFKML
jgi:hypothetical protein